MILPKLVKQFFNEREVTSSLVMDALFAGCRLLEAASTTVKAIGGSSGGSGASSGGSATGGGAAQVVTIDAAQGVFRLQGDAVQLSSCATFDSLPLSQLRVRYLVTDPRVCCPALLPVGIKRSLTGSARLASAR